MARKIATNGARLGDFINPGDRVRLFFSKTARLDVNVRGIDEDGDAYPVDDLPSPHVFHSRVTHVQILRKAPPPPPVAEASFGGVRLLFDGALRVNGEIVSEDLVYAIAYTIGLVSVAAGETVEEYGRAWDTRLRITPTSFQAGCATCTREDLILALTWAFEQYGWGDIADYA